MGRSALTIKRSALQPSLVAALAAIILLAFGLRALRLDFVNFHSDEASFIRIAYQDTILQATAIDDPHPPLFLYMLRSWMGPAGATQYGIRFLPLLYGVLLAPVMYQLGRLLGSRRLGLAAAFVVAVNPAFIFYAKEIRDYGLTAFTGALSFVVLLLAYRRPQRLPAYIVAALAALGSHYYAIPIIALQLLVLALLLWRDGKLRPWPWLAAPGVLAIAYTPWLLYARSTIADYNVGQGSWQMVRDVLGQTFEAFNFGFAVNVGELFWPSIVCGVLVVVGLAALRALTPTPYPLLPVTYLVAPILFGLVTLLHQTNFAPRYLFAGAPGYALILAGGLTLLWRWQPLLGGLGGAFLLGLTGMSIRNVDFSTDFAPNGYKELVSYLGQHAAPADAVVLDGVSQWPLYWYYAQLRGGLEQRVEFLPRDTLPGTEQAVPQLLAGAGAWYVESDVLRYDPNKDTERLLAADGYQAYDGHFTGQRLEYFAGHPVGQLQPLDATAGSLKLLAATKAAGAVPPDRPIGAELDWQRGAAPVSPFKLSLRLETSSGAVVAQNDTVPLGGYFDFAAWQPAQTMHERAGLFLPDRIPPGSYHLRAIPYDAATIQGLGAPLDLGMVEIVR
ncbi:MAG TPA: glycosyltransferase family 39 protein [Chloroflexota bacterium]|nr:glycosyltransferase family 39 protein [Chloroflexota bacterium]